MSFVDPAPSTDVVAPARPGPGGVVTAAPDPDEPGWRRAPVGRDEVRNDAVVAGGLLVLALLSMVLQRIAGVYEEPAAGWVSLLCLAATMLPLALRRRLPSVVVAVVTVMFIVTVMLRVPETLVINIALFMALYSVGAWEPDRRRATWVRLTVVVVMLGWLLIQIFLTVTDPESMPDFSRAGVLSPLIAFLLTQLLTNILYFAGAYWFGDHAWRSARERARTAYRGRLLQLERQVVERQAVALERLRMARELHDAVAHHVSMMGVQAAAARTLLGTDLDRAGQALARVEDSARQGIDELQGMLGMLRSSATDLPGERDALPSAQDGVGSLSVERIPELVERAAAAGLPTDYTVVGEPVPLPPLVSLNLYRIAQEALTNTRKHGGVRARADVRLRYLPGAVELEVADDGAGGRTTGLPSSGLGLVGMRERVAADGGTLEAGPRQRGGFLVRAHVPLRSEK